MYHLAIADDIPGGLEQTQSRPQILAEALLAFGGGWLVLLGKHIIGQLIPVRFEYFQFTAGGETRGSEIAVFKVAVSTGVLVEEEVLVGPLEVETIGQRFTNQRVGKHLSAGVEGKTLHA